MSAIPVLIIEDELHIRRLLAATLRRAGYDAIEAATAREGLSLASIAKPLAVLLDLGLPDRDGLELITALREAAAVIVVSARDATEEKIAALDLGADDYVTKPFDTEELLARLRSALRRRGRERGEEKVVTIGEIEIDMINRSVRRAGDEVRLTPKEYAVLAALAAHPGRIVTHANLLREVWGPAHEKDVEYLRVAARGLRLKLEADPSRPLMIRNDPGIGYRLVGAT